ncbi:hypothetical protein [Edaphobacter modestus]|uniref:HEAT repeat protein n=1 Tax=Edaphobacter modestus TaxID=388466 RepID=A0A4Q7YTS8_9BACT|nr:hypothetical protein [Edaphobacter modestus]RZU41167.1 hypothetical protein BDD14_2668 [Edaphobacter modestus]
MNSLARSLSEGRWGLERAREIARDVVSRRSAVKALVSAMFGEEPELRKRASDVAHRVTDIDVALLRPYADELAGLLAETQPEESRTLWHLGLVVSRTAHTREQRLRAARMMQVQLENESNVARCSAVEGLGLLASEEPELYDIASELIEKALRDGTLAMKARARHAKRRLEDARKRAGDLG